MDASAKKVAGRKRRHVRVRKKISGTGARPRMGVHRTLKHIYGMLVNDETGTVLLQVSTLTPEIRKQHNSGGNIAAATAVGSLLAKKAKEQNFKAVVFDRAGYRFHGRVKALADAARAEGMEF